MSEPKQGRSLPWFRVDVDLVDHPKVDALADALKEPLAVAYVIRFWAWTMRYAARGRLAPGARRSVERACGWRGVDGELWRALSETGWLEVNHDGSAEVHDWDEHNGAAVVKAEKDAERKRNDRKRRADGAGRSVAAGADGRADGAGNGTGRDGTGRDGTSKDSVEQARPVDLEAKLTDDEFQVFEHWRRRLNHPKAKPTTERKRLIAKQLKVYPREDLQRAIDGCARSPHHMGRNDRNTRYDDLELILRDAKHIEQFMGLANVS